MKVVTTKGLGLPNQRGNEAQHLETPKFGMFSRVSRRTQSNSPQNKCSHKKGIGKEVHEVPERERAPGRKAQQLEDLSQRERKTKSRALGNALTLKLSESLNLSEYIAGKNHGRLTIEREG